MDTQQEIKKSFSEAAQEFDGTSKLFRELSSHQNDIAELRRKGASYDTISELLKSDGVIVSWKTVARFCQTFLHSNKCRKRRSVLPKGAERFASNGNAKQTESGNGTSDQAALQERRDKITGPWTPKKKGPRIADSKNL